MSLDATWLLVGLGVVCVVYALGLWWLERQMAKRGVPQVTVTAPSPVVVPSPVVQVVPTERLRRGKPVTLELRSGSLRRVLGTQVCEDNKRPAVLTCRAAGVIGNFVADHQAADGTWVYRRVGVEREG